MKAAAVFAARLALNVLVLIVSFVVASAVSGIARVVPEETETAGAAQAAATLPSLVLFTSLVAAVFTWIIQRSQWRGSKLIAALVVVFYGLMTFITQIESLAYLRGKLPDGLIERLFLMGAVVAVLFIPAAVGVMGKFRGRSETANGLVLPDGRTAVHIAALAFAYVALYYLFGHYVAWQNPDVRQYYSGTTDLNSFADQLQITWSRTPWMLPFQFARGVLWVVLALPVVRMMQTSRLETAGIIAALFAVWSFMLLMPNPLMPASVARSHFWETLWCDLLLGALAGWVLNATPGQSIFVRA